MSYPRCVRRELTGAVLATLCGASTAPGHEPGVPAADGAQSGPRYYSVQMHLHGSMSEQRGSMRGHNHVAKELDNIDVLWWTDHAWRIAGHTFLDGFDFEAQEHSLPIPFRNVAWRQDHDSIAVGWSLMAASPRLQDGWARLTNASAFRGERSLRIGATSGPDNPRWQWMTVVLTADGQRLSRSLAGEVTLRLAVRPAGSSPGNAQLVVRCALSRQIEGLAQLWYVFGDQGQRRTLRRDDEIIGIVPRLVTPGVWTDVEMPVTVDAAALGLGGVDNSLFSVQIGVRVRQGATGEWLVDDLRIEQRLIGQPLLEREKDMAREYGREFDLTNHVGLEISYAQHMNVYGPGIGMPDFSRYPHGMTPSEVVHWVRERGGVVSYNHIYGTKIEGNRTAAEYTERRKTLLDNRAFGADMLEIGYPHRELPLEDHLATWDALSKRRVFITATGTSDSHDQNTGWRDGNNYVTWVWARSPDQQDLIKGVRRGRAVFGDPAQFHGRLDLATADGHQMGQVVHTDRPEHEVTLTLTRLPDGCVVKWVVDGEVRDVVRPGPGDFQYTITVDTRAYRFVRAEVWRGDRGQAFSNCIYFVPESSGKEALSSVRAVRCPPGD